MATSSHARTGSIRNTAMFTTSRGASACSGLVSGRIGRSGSWAVKRTAGGWNSPSDKAACAASGKSHPTTSRTLAGSAD